MSSNLKDINGVCVVLAGLACSVIVRDELWKQFGYSRRPRRGSFWRRFMNPENRAYEDFIAKEGVVLAFLDVMSGISANISSQDRRIALLAGTSLNVCPVMNQVFEHEDYFQYLSAAVSDYCAGEPVQNIFVKRALRYFDMKKHPKFMVGVVELISTQVSAPPSEKGYVLTPQWFRSFFAENPPLHGEILSPEEKEDPKRHVQFFNSYGT